MFIGKGVATTEQLGLSLVCIVIAIATLSTSYAAPTSCTSILLETMYTQHTMCRMCALYTSYIPQSTHTRLILCALSTMSAFYTMNTPVCLFGFQSVCTSIGIFLAQFEEILFVLLWGRSRAVGDSWG